MQRDGGGCLDNKDEFDEAFLLQNQREMQKINNIFHAAFVVSFIPIAIDLLVGLAMLWAGLITLGLALFVQVFPKIICDIALIVIFMLSEQKNFKCTAAAIPALIVFVLIFSSGGEIAAVILMIQIILYIMCLLQYKNIDRLKDCPGYPDFNAVFFADRWDKRIISDEQVKQTIAQNKKEIADMDVIELEDPQALEIKNPRSMQDLFSDDTDGGL